MNKTASIILTTALVLGMGIIFWSNSNKDIETNGAKQNVEIKDGIQYVTIKARGGYSPRISEAQSGIPTKLIMKTAGTFDCSLSLVIRSVGFQKVLDRNGEEIIDLGTPEAGKQIQGLCSMGMYSFVVNFK